MKPDRPGFYWAIWTSPAKKTYEAEHIAFPVPHWDVVEVWENFLGEPCEADQAEKFAVSVPGVRETQWLHNFKWGDQVNWEC